MVGWTGLPPSARRLWEPVSESTSQRSRPIEWTADLARANCAVKGSTFAASTLWLQIQPTLGGLVHLIFCEILLVGATRQGEEGALFLVPCPSRRLMSDEALLQ